MSGGTHHFVIRDRGAEHVHRWAPECSCGTWVGRFHRRRKFAALEYRMTHGQKKEPAAWRHGPPPMVRRVPTPRHRLPETLR